MATTNQVSILVSAVDEASKVFNKITGSVNDFAKKNEETFKNMRNYGAVAFGTISALATKTAVAYADSQKQLARVDQTLQNIDYSNLSVGLDDVRKESSKFGAELQALSGIADEEASESFAKLFQRTKDVAQAQKLGVDIYAGAQDWGQIDVSFRRLVKRLYELKKVIGTRRPSKTRPAGKARWAIILSWKVAPAAASDSSELKTLSIIPGFFWARGKHFDIFNTNARITTSEYPPLRRIVRHWTNPKTGEIEYTRTVYR